MFYICYILHNTNLNIHILSYQVVHAWLPLYSWVGSQILPYQTIQFLFSAPNIIWYISETNLVQWFTLLYGLTLFKQPSLWLYDPCLVVLTVYGNELRLFLANSSPPLKLLITHALHSSSRTQIPRFSYNWFLQLVTIKRRWFPWIVY